MTNMRNKYMPPSAEQHRLISKLFTEYGTKLRTYVTISLLTSTTVVDADDVIEKTFSRLLKHGLPPNIKRDRVYLYLLNLARHQFISMVKDDLRTKELLTYKEYKKQKTRTRKTKIARWR